MIRMHRYPDGRSGLAAFCDYCGKRIKKDGCVYWDPDKGGEWVVIHKGHGTFDHETFPCSMDLEVEVVYLANSVGADTEEARKRAALMATI